MALTAPSLALILKRAASASDILKSLEIPYVQSDELDDDVCQAIADVQVLLEEIIELLTKAS